MTGDPGSLALEIVEDVLESARFASGKRMLKIGREDREWIAREIVRDLTSEGLLGGSAA